MRNGATSSVGVAAIVDVRSGVALAPLVAVEGGVAPGPESPELQPTSSITTHASTPNHHRIC
jgi:hypothetical protein